ncbi:precorrin-4 C(11)-methyltransferase [Parabacteroides distasonis]|uniref:Precorrin-4 C(11)-methyltransferase n=1 Tax=Parabacteroides distasonis TaxID=823 RepID=A0A174P2Q3_PARDI|nr:precorrin-4 C(11)-methyltransferase [Parabacteroides distasonis]MRY82897.1 precorrin-4 C(11)-methyltransferase [Parabacteroides distasonis]MRZ04850.1 precorrin-4 C(11)-methyltransferase [Parabacteroides distasonis]CUP53771.1 Cobalt-precorrin-4 C(11)-methyltransferase [Parabacteroides distasonis]
MSTISIIPISDSSRVLAERILASYPEAKILPCGSFSKEVFHESSSLVFIGAMGICVRSIAPFAEDKHTDPAVVCIDSTGKYVIPVLSGHIGGANDLSKELANLLGAEAIITTQSDNTNLWPLDTLGKKYDWTLIAKDSNAAISTFVNGKPTALLLDIRDKGTDYLERTAPPHVSIFYSFEAIPQQDYELLMIVSPKQYDTSIHTITYIPKVLHLGMGCRKDMQGDPTVVYEHIKDVLRNKRLYPEALADVNTIDLKKCEPVLTLLAYGVMECPFHTYTSEELKDIPVPNPSEKVLEVTESPSVSEASAIYAAHGGPLLVEKQKADLGKGNEYTFAVALDRTACREGHIEIVGAGPGDPDLISIRGRQMLEKADLILYAGSLVPKELTLCAKAGATVRSSADMNLEEQFALMKEFYDKGLFVVRLHTGDPCIYGAIQEQMNYFDQYGMDYHITPGISSFQAAAAALYSQFTIPEKVQTIILTRGEGRTPMPEKEQLHKLAQSQSTMCIFLSAGVVEKVQEELSRHYAPTTPVAACYKLTWKDERIYRGQLKDLAKIVKENHLTLTTLLVVGDAIDNRKGLSRLYADEFKHLFRK